MGGALIRRGAYMGGGTNSGIRQFGICVPWYNSIALMKKKNNKERDHGTIMQLMQEFQEFIGLLVIV